MEITPPRSDNDTVSPKQYSDDASGKQPGPLRKKSGFSSFMSSMLGSPRTIKISAPENPVHMIHVGYDNVTGQFTVRLSASRSVPLVVVLLPNPGHGLAICREPISANVVFRAFPKTGRGCSRRMEYRKRSRSRIRK